MHLGLQQKKEKKEKGILTRVQCCVGISAGIQHRYKWKVQEHGALAQVPSGNVSFVGLFWDSSQKFGLW